MFVPKRGARKKHDPMQAQRAKHLADLAKLNDPDYVANGALAANSPKGLKNKDLIEKPKRVRPRKDPKNYEGMTKKYVLFSQQVEVVTLNDWFNGFIIAVILLAGILVGIQTYGCSEDMVDKVPYTCNPDLYENPIMETIDSIILAIFTIECFLKMMAEGMEPWRYFTGPEWGWNNFDFIIVLLCMPFIPIDLGPVLRLLRLLRVMKLVKKIPQLQMIIEGLFSGMKSISYIAILMFMVFYLYAILGMTLFKDNDPWHYGDIFVSINTLFRMMTLEDWTDVMYVNLYGCDSFNLEGRGSAERFSSGFFTNSLVPYLPNSNNVTLFNCDPEAAESMRGILSMWISVFYFFSFVVISSLVMLSLILGAITMGMADSMEEMKALRTESDRLAKVAAAEKRKKAYEKQHAVSVESHGMIDKFRSVSRRLTGSLGLTRVKVHPDITEGETPESGSPKLAATPPQTPTGSTLLLPPPPTPDGEQPAIEMSASLAVAETKSRMKPEPVQQTTAEYMQGLHDLRMGMPRSCLQSLGLSEDGSKEDLKRVVLHAAWHDEEISLEQIVEDFSNLGAHKAGPYKKMAVVMQRFRDNVVFVNFVTIVILSAGVVVGCEAEWGEAAWSEVANTVILVVFIVEIIVKVVAEYDRPLRYFYHHGASDKWNVFDFVVVAGSLMPMGDATSIVTMLRLLRLLRVLKLVKAFPQLQVIVEALVNGVNSVGYIGIIMFMFFYVFGILGMILFQNNDPWHFGTLGYTLVTLFRMATLEDWTDVMYINMHGCKYYGYSDYPELCLEENTVTTSAGSQLTALIYSWIIVIFGGLILVPLVIGVVVSSMEESVAAQKESQQLEEDLEKMLQSGMLCERLIKLYCKVFEMLDVDQAGTVDIDELILGLSMVGVHEKEGTLQDLMNEVLDGEVSGGGEMSQPNFVRFMSCAKDQRLAKKENAIRIEGKLADLGEVEQEDNIADNIADIGSKGVGSKVADAISKSDTDELTVTESDRARLELTVTESDRADLLKVVPEIPPQ